MLDAKDANTIHAIRALRSIASERSRPLILWVGAGASRWCGYTGWEELAHFFHSRFLREVTGYDKDSALGFLRARDFPAVFELCKDASLTLYNSLLVRSFGEPRTTPIFDRLIQLLGGITPLHLVTTNVDEALEKRLACITVQRSNIERVPDLIHAQTSFVCKLHGTISAVETTVFTQGNYTSLLANAGYLKTIEQIFSTGSTIFVGYGLRDKYVLEQLAKASAERALFGAGPHFAATIESDPGLPVRVQRIKYLDDERHDHRGSLQVLDIVNRAHSIVISKPEHQDVVEKSESLLSAYFIAHFLPPGVWSSSQQMQAVSPGKEVDITVGSGFIDSEVPSFASTAMHDLIVGLICFDFVYLPFSDLHKVHNLLTSEWFWILVKAGLLRFVDIPREPAIIFRDKSAIDGGDIGMMGLLGNEGGPLTIAEKIRKSLNPVKGREQEVEALFGKLEALVVALDEAQTVHLPELVRGALLLPSVQEVLGISEAFLPTKIPRWNVFPALRLANLLLVGQACQVLRIPAARIGFGGETLVNAAFSIASAQDWAEEVANYVLGARFNTDLGEMVFQNPQILHAILRFRDTQEGSCLRSRIRELLLLNEGHEFIASVNAGLQRNIPGKMLDEARNQLSGLLVPQGVALPVTGAVWNNIQNSDHSLRLWRARSLATLREYCKNYRIETYDACPCRSGEKLRFCCLHRLSA